MNFMQTILIEVSGYRVGRVFTIHDESMTGAKKPHATVAGTCVKVRSRQVDRRAQQDCEECFPADTQIS
jgi:hypothetical protein